MGHPQPLGCDMVPRTAKSATLGDTLYLISKQGQSWSVIIPGHSWLRDLLPSREKRARVFTRGEALTRSRWPDSFHSCGLFWFLRNFLHYCSQFDTVWAWDDNTNGITDDELKILNTIILGLHVPPINMSLGRRNHWPLGRVGNAKCHRIPRTFLMYLGAVTVAASLLWRGNQACCFIIGCLRQMNHRSTKSPGRAFMQCLLFYLAGMLCTIAGYILCIVPIVALLLQYLQEWWSHYNNMHQPCCWLTQAEYS